ncbi:MAG: endonuclease domain-containing protein [Sphingomonadaceae bacterium]|nr:endonuclease domain-containing protein [Sphingomonadaceae bacterium]
MARLSGSAKTVKKARKLRRKMSLPEALLWRELRKRPGELKFRRQHPAGNYILDFYCGEAKLAIEIDGESHNRGDQPDRDAKRDGWLANQDIRVLRFPASDVLNNLEGVVRNIVEVARGS